MEHREILVDDRVKFLQIVDLIAVRLDLVMALIIVVGCQGQGPEAPVRLAPIIFRQHPVVLEGLAITLLFIHIFLEQAVAELIIHVPAHQHLLDQKGLGKPLQTL